MRTNSTKPINCVDCDAVFQTKRVDKSVCQPCALVRRKAYNEEYRKRPENIARVASLRRGLRQKVIDMYGGKCNCCGETQFEFLAIDHVNGGGRQERETLSSWQLVNKVYKLNGSPEYQILCHNCNSAKGWWGECPHKWKRTA